MPRTARGARRSTRQRCAGCHGATGRGVYDLTHASERLRTNDELKAWIRNPARIRPGVAMPAWEGILAEDEYGPLIEPVRSLAISTASSH